MSLTEPAALDADEAQDCLHYICCLDDVTICGIPLGDEGARLPVDTPGGVCKACAAIDEVDEFACPMRGDCIEEQFAEWVPFDQTGDNA